MTASGGQIQYRRMCVSTDPVIILTILKHKTSLTSKPQNLRVSWKTMQNYSVYPSQKL